MNPDLEKTTVKIPITQRDRALAQQQSQGVTLAEAKRIYLNCLAVRAVESYCHCLDIKINYEESDSYHSLILKFFDTANLWLENYGRIEIRCLLPDEISCQLPPEVKFDRKAYFLVRINEELSEAEILGFTTLVKDTITLDDLQPLASFLNLFSASSQQLSSVIHCLKDWLDGIIEAGWQRVDSVLTPQQLTPSLVRNISSATTETKQAKVINLGVEVAEQEVILVLTVIPNDNETIRVRVQVFPDGSQNYLPENLQLAMLAENGDILQSVCARSYDNYIQLRGFQGTVGDRFDIQISCNDVRVIESFIF